jgi:hypothetical protein
MLARKNPVVLAFLALRRKLIRLKCLLSTLSLNRVLKVTLLSSTGVEYEVPRETT